MMKSKNVVLLVLAGVVLAALVAANWPRRQDGSASAPTSTSAVTPSATPPAEQPQPTSVASTEPVPHFHERLEDALPLPKILPASRYRIPVVARAYRIAAQIPEVLAQQPCYCWCDKIGHGSLVDCFASDHGAGWAVCVKEVLLADQLTRAGLKPAEIRKAIMRGDWEQVKLDE